VARQRVAWKRSSHWWFDESLELGGGREVDTPDRALQAAAELAAKLAIDLAVILAVIPVVILAELGADVVWGSWGLAKRHL
jgi:hypothetical protein